MSPDLAAALLEGRTAVMTVVDFAPVLNAFLALAAAIISAATPIIAYALLARFKVANAADLSRQIGQAADAAAGAAYSYALQHEGGLTSIAVHNEAIAHGADYMIKKIPQKLKQAGVTPDAVNSLVSSRLGILLASDPTVSAGKPGPAQIPASPSTLSPGAAVVPIDGGLVQAVG